MDSLSVSQLCDYGVREAAADETSTDTTGDGTWSYSYDGNGNEAWMTKSTERWNCWINAMDQLTTVVKGTKSGQIPGHNPGPMKGKNGFENWLLARSGPAGSTHL